MASRRFLVVVSGANIYVTANPLRSDRCKRTKDSIATVRHLYLDFDIDGEAPTAVLSTSFAKYQILGRIDSFTFEQQESTLKLLAIPFDEDPACLHCTQVLRLPGFRNCENDPSYPITVKYPLRFDFESRRLSAGYSGGKCLAFAPCNPIAKAPGQAHQFRTRLGVDPAPTCLRKRRR
jgi:hypothetical protein